ncbi:hypothetical protein ABID82_002289 [Methylobacterium sp. PvP062]|uniref:Tail protein n=1 Tax=Methylobacterium radiotolerans TaxID=31998 RepID=A0ABV2NN05_9HYPH|nr:MULTISPECIES: hypothetical protein [unclassified Methylobacterium]MBP2495378.1 hypothetical protein [Methylobacterium sp. PvP105]MBP2504751.1 hypothetical protein [Methylobacterium sp. PvP109]MCX7335761.1 hypothetical protein [Hyphomicrobiales bacterium]
MAIYTIELQAHTGAGGVQTFYLADGPFNTAPDDLPANQHFHPSLQTPANFERALFSTGSTSGASSIGYGEIVVVNAHGRYDAWPDYAFDGRPCIVKAIPTDPENGKPLWSYRNAPVLIRGTVEAIDITDAFSTIRLRLYDRMTVLDKPLLTVKYAGTTTAGGLGVEGVEAQKDTGKPVIYGTKRNVAPVDVNPFDLIRQVSARACVSIKVFDGGVELTNVGDFATVAALTAAALSPGQYATCLALGLFRLGGAPVFPVTADVVAAGPTSAAGIARQMLLDFGLTPADLDGPAFDALAAAAPASCGISVSGDTTAISAISQVLASIGGWIISDNLGVFTVGRLVLPQGKPIAAFDEWQCRGSIERQAPGDSSNGIPAYRVTVLYGQIGQTQGDGDLAGAVPPSLRADLALEWRSAMAESPAVKEQHLLAAEITIDTCLADAADAQAEAQRLLAIYGARRDVWRIKVDMTALDYRFDDADGDPFTMAIRLGSVVRLTATRFLVPYRDLVVIGRVEDCVNNRIQFDLWG